MQFRSKTIPKANIYRCGKSERNIEDAGHRVDQEADAARLTCNTITVSAFHNHGRTTGIENPKVNRGSTSCQPVDTGGACAPGGMGLELWLF